MRRRLCVVLVVLSLGLLSGCALIQKGLDSVTPEISVGVYKDGVGGVTIGVKLEKNKSADEEPKAEENKVEVEK